MSLPEEVLDFTNVQVNGDLTLVALVGSHAYGTAHEGSDFDYRGVFQAATTDMFRLSKPQETYDRRDPDITLHELDKFARLAAAANPSIMEVLWAEPQFTSTVGLMLRAHRRIFLSAKAFNTYGGYAMQQMQKAQKGTGGSRGVKHFKREKFIIHIYRLMECGIHLLETGNLKLVVDDPEALRAKGEYPLERVERDFIVLNERLREARAGTALPPEPDYPSINRLLRKARMMDLGLSS